MDLMDRNDLRELLKQAAPGTLLGTYDCRERGVVEERSDGQQRWFRSDGTDQANRALAKLIAAAVNALPWLLDELDNEETASLAVINLLTEERDAARAEIKRLQAIAEDLAQSVGTWREVAEVGWGKPPAGIAEHLSSRILAKIRGVEP